MTTLKRTIVWFRGKDLRLSDHPCLSLALKSSAHILPVFILDPYFFAPERARQLPHRMQFLLDSLAELQRGIEALGSRLVLLDGRSVDVLPTIATSYGADQVVAQRWSDPLGRKRDTLVAARLSCPLRLLDGETLATPESIRTQNDTPYGVFTPFARSFRKHIDLKRPDPIPTRLPSVVGTFGGEVGALPTLEDLGFSRNPNLQPGGETQAHHRLRAFVANGLDTYETMRNRMDQRGTSRLSADLKFGTLSPRTVWWAVQDANAAQESVHAYQNELLWREFSHHSLWDKPTLLTQPFRAKWDGFPWVENSKHWDAWVAGTTGYPVVDAAARQLMKTGFVHNRARMIAASFLTKHLMIHYQRGADHYLKWLTDGDWAQNTAGWQWTAGCGCDAAPYFRIFNPTSQGKKFDPDGTYIRTWVPELATLPTRYIHAPHEAPDRVLQHAGVAIGETYPQPIVDHREARERYLSTAKRFLANAKT